MKSRVIFNLDRKRILINIPNSEKRLKINILLPPIETLCSLYHNQVKKDIQFGVYSLSKLFDVNYGVKI